MGFVEFEHLFEGKIADGVAVEDEEQPFLVIGLDDVLSQPERTCSSHGLGLLGVGKLDPVLFFERLEGLFDVVGLVVDGDDDFDDSHLGEGLHVKVLTSIWC